jgi:SAM-dependent methyltransferase
MDEAPARSGGATMDEAEFDRFADEYVEMHRRNIRISGEDPDFFARYKVEDMAGVWAERFPEGEARSILDFGGGVGASAPHLAALFPRADIIIADVSRRSLRVAAERGIARLTALPFDGETLPLEDDSADMAMAACVFHHIPEAAHVRLLDEIRRVLRPGGLMFVFEHNPWNPLTRRAVDTCPFDENAVLIAAPAMRRRFEAAGYRDVDAAYRIFFPGALRRLRPLERWMTRLPIGAQYRCIGVK